MANAPIPAPQGEIASLSDQLHRAHDVLRGKLQMLDARVSSVSRGPAPPAGETVGIPQGGAQTGHGRWLREMIDSADNMANHAQDILDRIEL